MLLYLVWIVIPLFIWSVLVMHTLRVFYWTQCAMLGLRCPYIALSTFCAQTVARSDHVSMGSPNPSCATALRCSVMRRSISRAFMPATGPGAGAACP